MTISFSGLLSGLDTSSWVEAFVSVKQEKVTTLKTKLTESQAKKATLTDTRAAFTAFRSALEKITDKKFGGTFDLFSKNTAKSTNENIFTATASNGAVRQNYDITVQQLATMTKATSKNSASAIADDDTKLTNLGITEGKLAVYVDGVKTSINIDKNSTLGDLKSQLDEAGINVEIDEKGVMSIKAKDPSNKISIGSTTDTTNFKSLVGLEAKEDGSYVSTNSLYKANLTTKLTDEDSGFNQRITAGTFTIGDAVFSIGAGTTLSSLISSINDNEEAQATAYWDDTTGKLMITSKKEGASYVNIEAGTSNFTDVMGLTESTWDEEGNVVSSKLLTDTQELGKNAIFSINGTSMTSASNTVTEDVSRIAGVTITLKKVTAEDDEKATLQVSQDHSELVESIKKFVETYNTTVSKIEEVTASGADLQRESSLTSFKSTIHNFAMGRNSDNGGAYLTLSQIGISSSSANSADLSTNTSTLKFDEQAFIQALEEDPASVEAILADENGVLTHMESAVETMLQAATGFFDVKQSTLDSDIKKSEEKISNQQTKIAAYKTQLEAKFKNMETLIGKMQQNYSSFLTSS